MAIYSQDWSMNLLLAYCIKLGWWKCAIGWLVGVWALLACWNCLPSAAVAGASQRIGAWESQARLACARALACWERVCSRAEASRHVRELFWQLYGRLMQSTGASRVMGVHGW